MRFCLLIIVMASLAGCHDKTIKSKYSSYIETRSNFLDRHYHNYEALRSQAIDSIQSYVDDSLRYVAFLVHYPPWQLDSIFIFNTDSTRFYTKLHYQSEKLLTAKLDCTIDFGGAYIKNRWYFFQMGTVTYVPRGEYHHDPYEPLTFEELSYIAWRRAIPGLIYGRRDGSIATDHKAIDRMLCETGRRICPDKETACVCNDSMTIAQNTHRRKFKLDKEDILRIQEDIQASKKPYVPPHKELTAWDRLWGKEEKLFDSEAWKKRYGSVNE